MNEILKAKRYLAESSARIIDVKNILRTGNPPSTLDLCNEAIELALQACLVLFGIPAEKDPRNSIMNNREKFPAWFVDKLEDVLPAREAPKDILDCIRRAEKLNDLVWELIKKVSES